METVIQKKEQVTEKWNVLKSSSGIRLKDEIKASLNDRQVCELTSKEIYTTLAYCMMLVGIRAENIPGDIEKKVIAAYLSKWYAYVTDAEIRLAFECAIAGRLNLDVRDVKPYENFSCAYISTILNAYRDLFSRLITKKELQPVKEEKKQLAPPDYRPLQLVNTYYLEFLHGSINWKMVTTKAYEIAVANCDLNLDAAVIEALIQQAKKDVLTAYRTELSLKKSFKIKNLMDVLENIDSAEACTNEDVDRRFKILCLQQWFQELKIKGVTVIESSK